MDHPSDYTTEITTLYRYISSKFCQIFPEFIRNDTDSILLKYWSEYIQDNIFSNREVEEAQTETKPECEISSASNKRTILECSEFYIQDLKTDKQLSKHYPNNLLFFHSCQSVYPDLRIMNWEILCPQIL